VHRVWVAQRRPPAGGDRVTHLYVAPNARATGVHAPGIPASSCMRRRCTVHTSDWRALAGSPENLHRVTACYERTSIEGMAARRYETEAHYVAYEVSRAGAPLERQPRLCKDALGWVRAQGFEVHLVALTADVDTPGHAPWTTETRAAFEGLWARASGPLATCGMYLSPKGYRLVQPLARPLLVEAGELALGVWLEALVAAGVWDSALQVHDWTRHMRTPHHVRQGARVEAPWQDWSRMCAIEVEAPAAAPVRRRAARRSAPRAPVTRFDEACPPGWERAADAIGAAIRGSVTSDWRRCYLALSGALLERCCPPSGLPAVVARVAEVAGAGDLAADRVGIAQGTVARWTSVDESTGQRPTVLGYAALREHFPAVAAALDATTVSGVEARVLRRLAEPAPAPVAVEEAVAIIAREIAGARGVVAIAAPPGAGKTRAVVDHARRLPVIQGRARPGGRIAVSAPRHDLAEQTAGQLPGSLHLFSPPSLMRGGRPVCAYADAAKGLAAGRQSVRREFCEGRGKSPCDAAEGCAARQGIEGDPNARLVVGVHGLVRDLREYAGPSGVLVVDEPGEVVLTERVTLDDLETADRYLDAFTAEYAASIAPALAAFTAWVRAGPLEAPLVSIHDAIRAGAAMVPAELLEAAQVEPEHVADGILVAAAGAIRPNARTKAPPLEWRSVALARANPARAAELGKASRLLDLLWRGVTAPVLVSARLDERQGDRAATLVSLDPDLLHALEHEGGVVILDANAALHLPAIELVLRELPHTRGTPTKLVALEVADGAPIARTILATATATRRSWMPRGVPDWPAILPPLRAALAWAREGGATRKVALLVPKEVHVGLAWALRPGDPATLKLVQASRVTRRVLERVRADLAPVLATFPGEILTGHYGALEGLDHLADCDATITLMDPRPNLGDEAIKAEYLGVDLDDRLDELAAAELQQAHGRLRTIHRRRPGRQLHVGAVVPAGWRNAEVRPLPVGRPANVAAMTAEELKAIREELGMGLREMARALSVSDRTIRRFESTDEPRAIPEDFARAVRALVPSAAETPSKSGSYLGVSAAASVNSAAPAAAGPLQGVSAAPLLQGVSAAPPRARRVHLEEIADA